MRLLVILGLLCGLLVLSMRGGLLLVLLLSGLLIMSGLWLLAGVCLILWLALRVLRLRLILGLSVWLLSGLLVMGRLRLLAGVYSLALYFYITFARDALRLAPATVGVYNTVQTVGGILFFAPAFPERFRFLAQPLELLFDLTRPRLIDGDAVEAVALEGDLALALRASMSLPAVFVPREVGGRPLIDGGVSVNLPVDVVRSMGADIVIAVDISTPMARWF